MKRYVKLIMLFMVILMLISTSVNALNDTNQTNTAGTSGGTSGTSGSFTPSITANKASVPESSEVVVTIKVSNIDVGANGINELNGVLKYSTDVFEQISDTNIDGLEGWVPQYTAETGELKLLSTTFVKEDQSIAQITFKTKSGVVGSIGNISLENIEASNSEIEIPATNVSTNITVSAQSPLNSVMNIANNNNVTNMAPQTNVVNNTVNNTAPINSNPSNTEMPYTGVEDNIMFAIIIVGIIAVISFIKYKSVKY